jgi:flagellar motor switch protein FliN/FliY
MAEEAQAVEEKQDQQQDTSQQDAKKKAQSVELSEAVGTEATGAGGSIDILLDMNVVVTVTVGQTEIPVQRLLQLGPGSVLKLDKSIDEPAELYLRDTKFATGDIVVVDGRFAVKIKHILGLGDSADKAGTA